MTPRWVISHFHQLPLHSRTVKYLGGPKAEWGTQEHLLADLRDQGLLNTYTIQHLLAFAATKFKGNAYEKIMKDAPEFPLRPGDEPKKQEIELATKDELLMFFGAGSQQPLVGATPPRGRKTGTIKKKGRSG